MNKDRKMITPSTIARSTTILSIAALLSVGTWNTASSSGASDFAPSGLQFIGVGADGSTLVSAVTSRLAVFDNSTIRLIEAANSLKNLSISKQASLNSVGINGSGLQGINGSGLQGINGSGLQGINGSGLQGINGSGLQGINGSGLQGITAASTDSSRVYRPRANLIAIGPVSSNSTRKDQIAVLGQSVSINSATRILAHRIAAPGYETAASSSLHQGDFVVVLGEVTDHGQSVATDVILLPTLYSDGNTPIYLRGYLAVSPNSSGEIQIGTARINIASAIASGRGADLSAGSVVEVFGRTCGSNAKGSTTTCVTASSSSLID